MPSSTLPSNGWRNCATDPPEFKEDGWAAQESAYVLAFRAPGFMVVARAVKWTDGADECGVVWIERGRDGYRIHPTHWRPLPPPPKDEP